MWTEDKKVLTLVWFLVETCLSNGCKISVFNFQAIARGIVCSVNRFSWKNLLIVLILKGEHLDALNNVPLFDCRTTGTSSVGHWMARFGYGTSPRRKSLYGTKSMVQVRCLNLFSKAFIVLIVFIPFIAFNKA